MREQIVHAEDLRNTLLRLVASVRDATGTPGVSVGVSIDGLRTVASSGFADIGREWPLLPSTRFSIGCISKLLISIVFCQLEHEGRVSYDDPLSAWLPTIVGDSRLKLSHLTTHTIGRQGPRMIGVPLRQFEWDSFSTSFADLAHIFEEGSVFNYENTSHVILGEIIERITGKDINFILQEKIFQPLGIEPSVLLRDYRSKDIYCAPHRKDEYGTITSFVPIPGGTFWRASLSDLTLTVDDLLKIGEALVGSREHSHLSFVDDVLRARLVSIPPTVSGDNREHSPSFFNAICAEYNGGWFGYAGSGGGHTCALRFNPSENSVSVVAVNMWLPVIRDKLMDRLCRTRTHAESGSPGGNPGFKSNDLVGRYVGGGNVIRNVLVAFEHDNLVFAFGDTAITAAQIRFNLDERNQLVPEPQSVQPGIGFFPEPRTGAPCLQVGLAALRKTT